MSPVTPFSSQENRSVACERFDWDKPISGPLLDAGEAWKAELPLLVNQPSTPYVFEQIHVFADASEVAFGAAAYWRFETQDHSYHCSFIFGKTRLALIKPLTIPRLEVQAAVMTMRMSQTIQKELDVIPSQITYWTDSITVLSYIKRSRDQVPYLRLQPSC